MVFKLPSFGIHFNLMLSARRLLGCGMAGKTLYEHFN